MTIMNGGKSVLALVVAVWLLLPAHAAAQISAGGAGSAMPADGVFMSSKAVAQARARYLMSDAERTLLKSGLDGAGFAKPDLLQRIEAGVAGAKERDNPLPIYYFQNLNEMMSIKGIGVVRSECLALYDPGLTAHLVRTLANAMGLDGDMDSVSRRGLQLLGETARQFQKKGLGAIVDGGGQRQEFEESGRKDAVLLVQRYGCAHPLVVRIYDNLKRLYRGDRMLESPTHALRERYTSWQSTAGKQCVAQYTSAAFCDCLIGRMLNARLNATAWELLASDFTKVPQVLLAVPEPRSQLRACYGA